MKSHSTIKNPLVIFLGSIVALSAAADPTPDPQVREMSTDRPDRTESAYTVPHRHFQLETDLVAVTQEAGERSYSFNNMNLKYGVSTDSDLQLIVETFGKDPDASGVGNTTVRYKYNLFGNDSGAVAVALMPYVTLPTQDKSRGESWLEGGLIVPIAFQAPHDFSIGLMLEMDRVRGSGDAGYDTQIVSSITAAHELVLGLSGYIELFSQASTGAAGAWEGTLDAGITLPVGDSIQWDIGANVGISPAAEDFTGFLGLSLRN